MLNPIGVASASSDTASALASARARAGELQREATAAATALTIAEGRAQELGEQVAALRIRIDAQRARIDELTALVRERAVVAYTTGATSEVLDAVVLENPLVAARRTKFLDRANASDDRLRRELDDARADLVVEQRDVERRREEQQRANVELADNFAAAQTALDAANQARDELAARLEREQTAAAQAEAARLRAEQAARQASQANRVTSGGPSGGGSGGGPGGGSGGGSGPGPGQVLPNPGGGSFQCPVSGSSYSAGYGPRGGGFHNGIDMFAPYGTPEVAVKSGTVSFVPMAGSGGNEIYLSADDGNVYYYAHAAQFVGGPRRVSQGEVIALVGSTGNASGDHLHFEIRLGGANGQRVDPYPTLQAAGC